MLPADGSNVGVASAIRLQTPFAANGAIPCHIGYAGCCAGKPTMSFSLRQVQHRMPFLQLLTTNPLEAVAWVLAIILAITVHEFSHALVAWLQGDSTAQLEGRVTLNPIAHVDPVGFIALILVGFGWGKPVPFNPYNLKAKRWGPALVSLAGPVSNLLGVILFGLVLRLVLQFSTLPSDNLLITFLILCVQFNVVLMLFNLLPVPPLDGSKLLQLLPSRFDYIIENLNKYGFIILLAVVLLGQPILSRLFGNVTSFVFDLFLRGLT